MPQVTRKNPNALQQLNLRLKELEGVVAKTGWFQSAKYESGTSVAYIAAIQEFGSPRNSIPPRPTMRPTVISKKKEWAALAASGVKAILAATATAPQVMGALGHKAAGDIAKTITELYSPPLSPITLELRARRARGDVITGRTVGEAARAVAAPGYQTPNVSTKPLVESGILLNALTSKVENAQ